MEIKVISETVYQITRTFNNSEKTITQKVVELLERKRSEEEDNANTNSE